MTEHEQPRAVSPVRRRISIIVVILLLLGGAAYIADQKYRPRLTDGPMVQIPGPRSLAVVWNGRSVSGRGWVELSSPNGTKVVQSRNVDSNGRYEVQFDDLQPGAHYSYTVFIGGLFGRKIQVSGPHETSTAFTRGTPFRFIAFGDSGSGSNTQASLAELISKQKAEVVIHVGDLIYPSGRMEDYHTNFFLPNAGFLPHAPFMASLGNHDIATEDGKPLLKEFVLPQNGPKGIEAERNYFFDYGDARFIALDSNCTEAGGIISEEQMATVIAPWVREVLTNCDARWKFVFFHHPYFTGSTHGEGGGAHMKRAYMKAFEDSGVDIVFCGHNHLYERTSPMLEDKIVPMGKGIIYITTGAGGASRYAENKKPPKYLQKHDDEVFSFTCVDLSADKLELKQIGEKGETLDTLEIKKPSRSLLN